MQTFATQPTVRYFRHFVQQQRHGKQWNKQKGSSLLTNKFRFVLITFEGAEEGPQPILKSGERNRPIILLHQLAAPVKAIGAREFPYHNCIWLLVFLFFRYSSMGTKC